MSHSRHLVVATAILAITGCGTEPTVTTPADGGAIRFVSHEIVAESRSCAESEERCARVRLTALETAGGGTEAARDNLDLFLDHDRVSRMRSLLPEDVGDRISDIDGLVAAFLAEHRAFVEDFPDATAAWNVEISATAITSTPTVATIDITEFAYTGGAHPNSRRRLVSFDVESGRLLGVDDLTGDIEALTALAERHLRADRGLDPDGDLEAAGFWFPEGGGFALPDNFGIAVEGIVFHWDPYEIAPYSMGPIDVTVPADELAAIIGRKFW
jgi:hypothetical protein